MGQFFIAQMGREGVVGDLFLRGREAFREIAGLTPFGRMESKHIAMACFPKLAAPSTGLVTSIQSGIHTCEAGLAIYRGRSGPEALIELAWDIVSTDGDAELDRKLQKLEGI